jgi:nickel transport protein
MDRSLFLKGVILSFLLFLSLQGNTAHAHRVYLYAWVEGDVVHTEGYFGGKKKAIGGTIDVFDPSGKKLLEGKADEKGEFSFKIPQKTDLRIVLEATMGHRAEYTLKAEEFAGAKPASEQPSAQKTETPGRPVLPETVDTEKIRKVVEEVLDARLKPLTRAVAELGKEKGPGFTEIIGGIGYILGLMGLVAYFKSRKNGGKEG